MMDNKKFDSLNGLEKLKIEIQISGLKWYLTGGDITSLSLQKKMVELSRIKTQMLF